MGDPNKLDYASPDANTNARRRRTHPATAVAGVLIYSFLTWIFGMGAFALFSGSGVSQESPFRPPSGIWGLLPFAIMLFFGWRTIAAANSLSEKSK